MSPRIADPFKPQPGVTYSKGEVNRAGQLLRRILTTPAEDDAALPPIDDWDRVIEAMFAVEWWRQLHARPLSRVAAGLRHHVAQEGALVDGRVDVAQRLKKRATIFSKLEREPTMALTQMYDIGGVRARLRSLEHVAAVSRRLKKNWRIAKTKDYISEPKASGYRALHHVVHRDGRLIEVQLRTVRQDAWANQVEEDSRTTAVGFKFGAGSDDVHGYYRAMAVAFEHMDRGEPLPVELVDELNQRFTAVGTHLRRRRNGGS